MSQPKFLTNDEQLRIQSRAEELAAEDFENCLSHSRAETWLSHEADYTDVIELCGRAIRRESCVDTDDVELWAAIDKLRVQYVRENFNHFWNAAENESNF